MNVLDLFSMSVETAVGTKFGAWARWLVKNYPKWPPRTRAILVVCCLLLLTLLSGGIARSSGHAYLPMILLGMIYGAVSSVPVMKFLGPKIQAAVGGFLGGISVGNIGSKEAAARSMIRSVAQTINESVTQVFSAIPGTELGKWNYMETGIVLCIWTAIVTAFLIVIANASLTAGAPPNAIAVPNADPGHAAAGGG